MKYSDVLRSMFYGLKMSDEISFLIDIHFTGAAHHNRMYFKSTTEASRRFHWDHSRAHLDNLITLVTSKADFGSAIDITGRNLDKKATWRRVLLEQMLPDPDMFNAFIPDKSFHIGDTHPNDMYLKVFKGRESSGYLEFVSNSDLNVKNQ